MRDDEKDEWMDVFVFWSKANIMATTSVYFFLSWVRGKPSFLHMTVAEESPSTSQGKTASWPIFAVTIELPSFMTGGTGEKSQTLYVEIFLKCILNQLVMDSLTYRESPLWKTDWCFQRCWWPHSCTGRCPQAWLPVSRGTDPLPASVYDLPAERIEERCVSQFFFILSKTCFRFFSSLYLKFGLILVPLYFWSRIAVSQALQGQMSVNWHCECPHISRAKEGWWDWNTTTDY